MTSAFFPRGFMWDEGFHQLLISSWDIAITRDILAHWLDLMNSAGWIPREQILGAEARSRVPDEFVVQPPDNSNPPTWFLVVEDILDKIDAGSYSPLEKKENVEFLKGSFVRFEAWFGWFQLNQNGPTSDTFRWRGRRFFFFFFCVKRTRIHTHTHTHIKIYIYIYLYI